VVTNIIVRFWVCDYHLLHYYYEHHHEIVRQCPKQSQKHPELIFSAKAKYEVGYIYPYEHKNDMRILNIVGGKLTN